LIAWFRIISVSQDGVGREAVELQPKALHATVHEIDAASFREIPPVEGLGLLRRLAYFPVTEAPGEDEALSTVES
jgi:hypothetical protein